MKKRNKNIGYFIVTLLCIFTFMINTKALECSQGECYCNEEGTQCSVLRNPSGIYQKKFDKSFCGCPSANDGSNKGVTQSGNGCKFLFGDPTVDTTPAYWMQKILNFMKYIAIAALLILVTLDFVKALIADDKDAIKNAGKRAIKRFIFCVIIFFLPIIIELIMEFVGAYGTCIE